MPFIHIRSLPMNKSLDIANVIRGIAADFSARLDVQLDHIHTTWAFYRPGCYAKGKDTPEFQPDTGFPIIVDLLTPDFNNAETVALMLDAIAGSISARAGFPKNNIFINHRQAHSGMVFDDGETVRW